MRILLSLVIATTMVLAQFGKVNVVLDDRLLRDSERQEVSSLRDEITRFFSGRIWDEDFHNLNIPLHISIAFQGVAQKGGLKTFHAQILVNDGMDLRYFDKSIQFYFNPGGAIHFDPVIFDPLGSFLAYYAYTVLAGYMDTYDFYGGNHAYDQAREIALRGIASDFPKGWSSRMQLLKEVTGNKGLREARFAYYVAMDLFNQGNPDAALKEFGFIPNTYISAFEIIDLDDGFIKIFDVEYNESNKIYLGGGSKKNTRKKRRKNKRRKNKRKTLKL